MIPFLLNPKNWGWIGLALAAVLCLFLWGRIGTLKLELRVIQGDLKYAEQIVATERKAREACVLNRAEILLHLKRVDKIRRDTDTKLKRLGETTTAGGKVNDAEITAPSATMDQYNSATDDFLKFMQQFESPGARTDGSGGVPITAPAPGAAEVGGGK